LWITAHLTRFRVVGVDSVCAGALEHPELIELDLGDNEADDDGALSIGTTRFRCMHS
jgi:hypothetical protein